MRAIHRGLTCVAILCCLAADGLHTASAQSADELFDGDTVKELRLFMNTRDLAELRERYKEDIYFPADLEWHGMKVANVGVKSRGISSRNPVKPGLRVDFNRYVSGQRFLGLASIALENLVSDPSMIRERLAMSLFRRMGASAPRESYARVYINDAYQGLYAIIESIDGDFLQRSFNERSGYLFERQFNGEYRGEDLGSDPAAYRPVFEPKNHEREPDAVLYSPIRDLFHEANYPVDTAWREQVSRYVDLKQLVSHVAVETFLSERDGFLGYAGMANFYLYRSMGSELHRVIPWDKDRAFDAIDSGIFLRANENVLFKGAMAFSDLHALYLDTLERCAQLATAGTWLSDEINHAWSLIATAAQEDKAKPYSNQEVDEAIEFLKRFARERPGFVLGQVERDRHPN